MSKAETRISGDGAHSVLSIACNGRLVYASAKVLTTCSFQRRLIREKYAKQSVYGGAEGTRFEDEPKPIWPYALDGGH